MPTLFSLNSDLSENVPYNNPAFPFHVHKEDEISHYSISHWHDDLEFVVILEGELFYMVNGQKIPLQRGEGLFINSKSIHYGTLEDCDYCSFIACLFSLKLFPDNAYFLEEYVKPLISDPMIPFQKLSLDSSWQKEIMTLITNLYEIFSCKEEPFIALESLSRIVKLLTENAVTSQGSKPPTNSEEIQIVTAMMGYVQKNYANKILLKDLALAGNCCKTRCTQLFQKYLSTSPMVYVNNYRLEKSRSLLRYSNYSVTEISYLCGFTSSSYFCEAFHKYYDLTPKQYRKQNPLNS